MTSFGCRTIHENILNHRPYFRRLTENTDFDFEKKEMKVFFYKNANLFLGFGTKFSSTLYVRHEEFGTQK